MPGERGAASGGHRARKRFGQHFLADGAYIAAIVREVAPKPDDSVIEIGPGLGALTKPLLERCDRLTVIELDRDLAARLRRNERITVVESDVLRVDFGELADAARRPLRIVGNLPYNISTPILFHLLPFAERVEDQTFMLQKEVCDRIAASPGTKAFGRLSVMLQWRYHVESLLHVPPEAFEPPPQVDSAVIRMTPWPQPAVLDPARLEAMLAAAFSQRRKLLRHALGPWLDSQGYAGDFDLQRRAEEVPVEAYLALAQALPESAPP